jgi:hypothetical protein
MGRPKMPEEHGTARGYGQHIRSRTIPCVSCVDAHRLTTWAWRIRRGDMKGLTIPLGVLADVLAGETDSLAAYLGPEVADAVTGRVVSRMGCAA